MGRSGEGTQQNHLSTYLKLRFKHSVSVNTGSGGGERGGLSEEGTLGLRPEWLGTSVDSINPKGLD